MIPILFGQDETTFTTNGIGRLSDAVSCVITEERNGLFELTMQYPMDGAYYSSLAEEMIIFAQPRPGAANQAFRIYELSKPIDGVVTVSARHISYALNKTVVMPYTANSCVAALSFINDNVVDNSPFTYWTDKSVTANFKLRVPTTVRAMLGGTEGSILDTFGTGEYEWDMYTVKFHLHRGQNSGVTIRYGKNLTDLKNETSTENVYTAIVPFYANETTVVTLPERILYGDHIDDYPELMAVPVDFSERFGETVPTVEQLRSAASTYLNRSDNWKLGQNIEVSFVNLADTEEYKNVATLQRVNLCDTVTVIHPQLEVEATAKVIKVEYNVLAERYNSLELGDSTTNLSQAVIEASGLARQVVTKTALQLAIEHATEMITGGLGGHIVINRNADGQPEELLIMDTDDVNTAVNVWRWNLGGLGHSHNGYNGPFNDVALTADGRINATMIATGILDATLIRTGLLTSTLNPDTYWDLDSGVLHLSAATAQQVAQYVDANGWYFSTPYTIDEDFVALFSAYLQNGDTDVTFSYAAHDYTWYVKTDFESTYLQTGYILEYDLHDLPYGGTIVCEFHPHDYFDLMTDGEDDVVTFGDDNIALLSEVPGFGHFIVENDFISGVRTASLETSVDGLISNVQEITTEQELLSSRISQSAHTIEMSVSGTVGNTPATGAGITISLKDEEGNIISTGNGRIVISGDAVFKNNLTDGTTTISGSNITTGTIRGASLILGGLNNTNGTLSVRNSGNEVMGTWNNAGLSVSDPDTFRTSITTDGKIHVYKYDSGWKEIGVVGQYTFENTYQTFGLNANQTNTAGFTISVNGTPYYAMNTSDTAGQGLDLTGYGFRHYFRGDVYCTGVFKTSNGYGWFGEFIDDDPYVTTGANVQIGEHATGGLLYVLGNIQSNGEIFSQHGMCTGSDITLKTDIAEISADKSVETIMSLRPVEYRYKENTERLRHGFIAQDVRDSVDWGVVSADKNGTLTLSYEDFIADLVKVVQLQEERIKDLERRNRA